MTARCGACPGNLVEQWQDELWRKFNLPFEIATNDKLEAARTGNWFRENSLCIARLDKLSRNEDVQAKLKDTDWDLIVCDEAHKMSAIFFGGEVKYTKRYHLGRLLSGLKRVGQIEGYPQRSLEKVTHPPVLSTAGLRNPNPDAPPSPFVRAKVDNRAHRKSWNLPARLVQWQPCENTHQRATSRHSG